MFTMAGWNTRARSTGIVAWTMSARGNVGGFAPAMLYRHKSGDLFWIGLDRRFVVWGETCRFATLFDAAPGGRVVFCKRLNYFGGSRCDVDTRKERNYGE